MYDSLQRHRYTWPQVHLDASPKWTPIEDGRALSREMPEDRSELTDDSRWPAFFPCSVALATTTNGVKVALERIVGASIVNRFPYVVAITLCRETLSKRHHPRRVFMDLLEQQGNLALQFLPPGPDHDRALETIAAVPDSRTDTRIEHTQLPTRKALTNDSPVFDAAYMVYEATLVQPGRDFDGAPIYPTPWTDVGSHRIYFLEINAIQLRRDIAEGRNQILWRSLPAWESSEALKASDDPITEPDLSDRYRRAYTAHYAFPSASTTAFEADAMEGDMAVKYLPKLAQNQIEIDNDRARWPCFFPSSVGMITTWSPDGCPNLMPCGSTTVVSRHPLVIAPCISYAAINVRYAPRATLDLIRRTGRFGCGVPFIDDRVVSAIRYAGNVSLADDPNKTANTGLDVLKNDWSPVIPDLPIHFDCQATEEIRLGTHIMFLGRVRRIRVRTELTPENPMEWFPFPTLRSRLEVSKSPAPAAFATG